MSTALAIDPVRRPAAPAPVRPAAAPAPAPRPAAQPQARPRVLVGACLVAGAAAVVVVQLLLSVSTAEGAYRLAALEHRSATLTAQQQTREEALRTLAAPQHLAARAAALGMVPTDSPAYLDARTGRVLGARTAAPAPVGGVAR